MIAILSDIHANLEALTAVLEDIESIGVKEIYCLGDVIGYGPNPIECLEIAIQKFKFITMGNHEDAVLHGAKNFNVRADKAIRWTRDVIMDPDNPNASKYHNFLKNMPLQKIISNRVFLHGSPRNPTKEYIFPSDIKNPGKLHSIFNLIPHLCFVGHTHIPGVFTPDLKFETTQDLMNIYMIDQGKAIINIGSVGQPRDGDNRACYVTMDEESVVFRRVKYDYVKTMEKIKKIPELDNSLATRLADGK